ADEHVRVVLLDGREELLQDVLVVLAVAQRDLRLLVVHGPPDGDERVLLGGEARADRELLQVEDHEARLAAVLVLTAELGAGGEWDVHMAGPGASPLSVCLRRARGRRAPSGRSPRGTPRRPTTRSSPGAACRARPPAPRPRAASRSRPRAPS